MTQAINTSSPYGPPPKKAGTPLIITGLILIVLAAALGLFAVISGVRGISDTAQNMQQVLVPGSHVITLDQPGDYRIFHEYNSMLNGRTFTQQPGSLSMEATLTAPDGAAVTLIPDDSENYSFGAREGRSLFTFVIPAAGDYTLEVVTDQDTQAVLTVGPGILGMVGGIFSMVCGIFGAGLLFVIGLVLLIIGLVQRSRRGGASPPPGPPPTPAPPV